MSIHFDEKNLLADVVGRGHGVTRGEVERAQSRALKALHGFQKQSDAGLYGFAHLPFQTKVIVERRSTAAAMVENGRPNCTFTLDRVDAGHLGAFLQLMEFETAFMGELLNINAFNQEGVELGKKFTYRLMGRAGFETYREQFASYEKKRAAAN